jgi:hypothetical protein
VASPIAARCRRGTAPADRAAATLIGEAGGWYGSIDGEDLLALRPFIHRGGWIVAPPGLRDQLLDIARAARHISG